MRLSSKQQDALNWLYDRDHGISVGQDDHHQATWNALERKGLVHNSMKAYEDWNRFGTFCCTDEGCRVAASLAL